MDYEDIIDFWFKEITPQFWFKKDVHFDQEISKRFLTVYIAATQCELFHWRSTPLGCLAEVIVLDQFPRNIFRNSDKAFSSDSLALCLAQSAIDKGFDQEIPIAKRSFLYMPYMHSESLVIHDQALKLFATEGLENNLKFEIKHREIIKRFGRYPHRNGVLKRESSAEEKKFLQQPGSGF